MKNLKLEISFFVFFALFFATNLTADQSLIARGGEHHAAGAAHHENAHHDLNEHRDFGNRDGARDRAAARGFEAGEANGAAIGGGGVYVPEVINPTYAPVANPPPPAPLK